MPATAKTLKALRETLKALETTARSQARYEEQREHGPGRLNPFDYYRGRADGIAAVQKLVEQMCQ